MSKILVTGGAGFIGSHLVRHLTQMGEDVAVLDCLTYAANLNNLRSVNNFHLIVGDIADPVVVDKAMRGVDYVYHVAAETHVDRSIVDPSTFICSNVLGTDVLLNAAIKHGIKRFLYVSTDEVMGELEIGAKTKFKEDSPFDPKNPYSASKASAEHLVNAYHHTYGLNTVITRCCNNYGPFQLPDKLMAICIRKALDEEPLPICGDGSNVREWIYVTDHVRGIYRAMGYGKSGETYLFGTGNEQSNLEIAEVVLELCGLPTQAIEFIPDRAGNDKRYAIDFTKAKRELSWEPKVPFTTGVQASIEWYKHNPEHWMKGVK